MRERPTNDLVEPMVCRRQAPLAPEVFFGSTREFMRSLTPRQRGFFLATERLRHEQLQTALRQLSQGLSAVSALAGEALQPARENWASAARNDAPLLSEGLLQAYLATTYVVRGKKQDVSLRIGESSPWLAKLLAASHAAGAVYITACNPFGTPLSPEANETAMAGLRDTLDERGYEWLPGEGRGGEWPAEPSLLVPGVSAEEARSLCAEFRQNAVVWSGVDGVPMLLLHPEAAVSGTA